MILPSPRPAASPRPAWLLILLVFIVQVALIFGLGGYVPVQPRPARPSPRLRIAGAAAADWLALNDPTLFALPHERGFAGLAWLHPAPLALPAQSWSEPLRFTRLPLPQLGRGGLTAPAPDSSAAPAPAPPELILTDPLATSLQPGPSSFRIEDGLARRRLLTPLALEAWRHSDLLADSVVQLAVDALGRPVSVTLLAGCGRKEADDRALDLAAAARFDAVGAPAGRNANPPAQLAWGRLIFHWQTLPLPATNSPAPGS
jgi:hypothetical protein